MTKQKNPFTPSFGTTPPLLAGRSDVIDEFINGLEAGPGDPARATLYVGQRGSGKTVLLNALQDAARGRGWAVLSESATPGLVDRLVNEGLPQALNNVKSAGRTSRKRLTGLTAPGGFGAQWETVEDYPVRAGLRVLTNELTDCLGEDDGVLFTVDEVHRGQIDEIVQLSAVVQHAFREGRNVAFAGACLQSGLDALLSEPSSTFLRRAERHRLADVPLGDVVTALTKPVVDAKRTISADTAKLAAEATGGYPFLIQLIGFHMWRVNPSAKEITVEDVEAAVPAARRRLGTLVIEPSLQDVSDVDKTFLAAMAVDDGPSKIADVAKRMDVDGGYANVYRTRLLTQDIIVEAGRGKVAFATPGLGEYLREHVAVDELKKP